MEQVCPGAIGGSAHRAVLVYPHDRDRRAIGRVGQRTPQGNVIDRQHEIARGVDARGDGHAAGDVSSDREAAWNLPDTRINDREAMVVLLGLVLCLGHEDLAKPDGPDDEGG